MLIEVGFVTFCTHIIRMKVISIIPATNDHANVCNITPWLTPHSQVQLWWRREGGQQASRKKLWNFHRYWLVLTKLLERRVKQLRLLSPVSVPAQTEMQSGSHNPTAQSWTQERLPRSHLWYRSSLWRIYCRRHLSLSPCVWWRPVQWQLIARELCSRIELGGKESVQETTHISQRSGIPQSQTPRDNEGRISVAQLLE